MNGFVAASGAIVLLTVLVGGCNSRPSERVEGQPPAPVGSAPTLEELAGAAYSGLNDVEGAITLAGGEWHGEPFVPGGASRPRVTLAPGFRVTGDLDGDGYEEAVVVLAQSSGGSGTFDYLAAVSRNAGTLQNVATIALGDRVAIRSAAIDAGTLRVDVLRAGEGDAMCCPGELAELAWTLGPNGFVPGEAQGVTGRLSFDALGSSEWVLREWRPGEPAPAEPEVTLVYQGGRIVGGSGCNRYFAGIEAGGSPGDMTVGPIGATRMACAEAMEAIEARYLQQLAGVRKFGFLLGRLALTGQRADGSIDTMLFEPRTRSRDD